MSTGTDDATSSLGRRRGRRPAGEDTRGAILAAARDEFAERGFDGASIRSVARRADVDPALVRHYFRDKAELFVAGMIPAGADPAAIASGLAGDGVDGLGARLLTAVLRVWEADGGVAFRVAFAGITAGDLQAEALVGYVGREVFGQVARVLPPPDQQLRVSLVASQMVGVLVARHVLRLEPLASLPVDEVVALVGPTLQRYLSGPLT
ncbi:TetR family transcriptional regulator [Cellulomonas sp. Root137]|uniref:TetR/AcrR family transcriptional regulator n=1 Tax=Cellulomonas sp. Root137 TaxID=1736459 RepID=UPI0009E78348|nr:TetR family transcriptional regulator [Cellulomonas sp. Root137]